MKRKRFWDGQDEDRHLSAHLIEQLIHKTLKCDRKHEEHCCFCLSLDKSVCTFQSYITAWWDVHLESWIMWPASCDHCSIRWPASCDHCSIRWPASCDHCSIRWPASCDHCTIGVKQIFQDMFRVKWFHRLTEITRTGNVEITARFGSQEKLLRMTNWCPWELIAKEFFV